MRQRDNKRSGLLFQSGIAKCRSAGIEPSPDEVVEIWRAAKSAVEGDGELPALLEVPVVVGNVVLYPRTLGAALWWDRFGERWFGNGTPQDQVVALAWMLAHARKPEVFERTRRKSVAVARIVAWQFGIAASVTPAQLAWGIRKIFAHVGDAEEAPQGNDESASEADWGGVIARLCAAYGRRPEYFLWEIGERMAAEMLEHARLPGDPAPASNESRDGFANFVRVVRKIIAARKEAENV